MKTKVYSIHDTVAGAYNTPFFMHNNGQAMRAFSDNVNASDSIINKHPEQFALFQIGDYDDQTGEITPLPTVKCLALGSDVIDRDSVPVADVDHAVKELKTLIERMKALVSEN